MHIDISITDADRMLDFTLAVDCSYREGTRSRPGWRDGGEKGEAPAVEIERARCLDVVVWCGKTGVSAVPGLADDERLESRLGEWCLAHYAEEIERAVWEQLQARRRAVLI